MRRVSASICAIWQQLRVFPPSPSTRIRRRLPPAALMSSAVCLTLHKMRSATAYRSSTVSGPTAVWRRHASRVWRPKAVPRHCWFSHPHRLRWDSRRKWRSHISSALPMRPIYPLSSSNTHSVPARVIPRKRSSSFVKRCRQSGPSRIGSATCSITSGTCARCSTCPAR